MSRLDELPQDPSEVDPRILETPGVSRVLVGLTGDELFLLLGYLANAVEPVQVRLAERLTTAHKLIEYVDVRKRLVNRGG